MLSDWLFAAGVALLMFGTVLAMVLVAQWGVYALRRRQQIKDLRRAKFGATWGGPYMEVSAGEPADWVWPRFPETLAAKIEDGTRNT